MANAGRPLKWETEELLQAAIDDYFEKTPVELWTITGLALHLDTDRITLIRYENRERFSNTIKKAKLMVEHSYEIDLKKGGGAGVIFALKNFDWTDKTEIEATVNTNKLDSLVEQFEDIDDINEED